MLYEIPQVGFVQPDNLDDLTDILSTFGERAKLIGGGSDLLGLLKDRVSGPRFPVPEVLVSINGIQELKKLEHDADSGLKIGSAVTLSTLEEYALIQRRYPIISEAAHSVATPQIRNVATVGGNLCQRPWCWYFRHPDFPCFKKGGKQCYAIPGEHKYYFSTLGLGTCVMSHPSDLAPALVALDATLTIAGPKKTRRQIPIGQFFTGPKEVFENILKQDEVLVEISVRPEFGEYSGAYLKDRIRDTWDLSIASAAVLLKTSSRDAICEDARIVLGGLAPYPFRAHIAEKYLIGKKIREEDAELASSKELEKAKPLPQTRYKVDVGKAILKRAILSAVSRREL
jgi:xanthine dehydrogenase YagS FAD-binding subunit